MDSHRLTLFLSLAKHLHFQHASRECNVSASTLSRTIQQIEEELQTELFIRDNRSVQLTTQGGKFQTYALETLQQWSTLKESLQLEAEELKGNISLYCSVTASYSFLYNILTDFRKMHPKIGLTLHTGDHSLAIERISHGYEDLAIAARKDVMPAGIKFKKISNSPLVFIQSRRHPISTQHMIHEKAAEAQQFWLKTPMIISERGVARERIDQWFHKRNITPNIYAQVAGHEAIVSMVSLGFGVGLVPKIVLENSPLVDSVELFPFQPDIKAYEVGVCVLEKRLKSPVVKALWSQI